MVALQADRDLEAAWSLNQESLVHFRQLGDQRYLGVVNLALGRVARARGDLDEARRLVAEALRLQEQVGDVGNISTRLHVLAAIDADAGQLEQAVRLAGAASAMDEAMGIRSVPVVRRELQAWFEPARSALGDDVYAWCWGEGWAMSVEQAVEYALAITATESPRSSAPTPEPTLDDDSNVDPALSLVSRRERQIVGLVALGLTNRQIADRLVLSERTVEAHVHNILGKLALTSRSQIVIWAVEHGLAVARRS
jgi:non-specific serine/threonine protein kinase